MMKKIYYILLLCCLCYTSVAIAQQQESLRDRLAKKHQLDQGDTPNSDAAVPKLSTRAEMMNEALTRDLSNATWIREIYRELVLTKGANAALYHPVQPIGNQINFITLIFKLMAQGELTAYKWNNGQDTFSDELIEDFGDVLNKLEIPFQKNGNAYVFDEFSIPSNEVLSYYVKEAWYFDHTNSAMGVKTIAICPVLARQEYLDDVDSNTTSAAFRQPLFWIPYESIRPYAARVPIMASDMNNVMNKTINDYFQMRLYEGEIYKTTNMENVYLSQKFTTPETLKYAQDSIEAQLKQFDKNLWTINDSINSIFIENNKNNGKKAKASKPKTSKSSSSGTAYSARDRR